MILVDYASALTAPQVQGLGVLAPWRTGNAVSVGGLERMDLDQRRQAHLRRHPRH